MAEESKPADAPGAQAAEKKAAPAAAAKPKGPAPVDASGKPLVANLSMAVSGAVVAASEFVGETTVEIAAARGRYASVDIVRSPRSVGVSGYNSLARARKAARSLWEMFAACHLHRVIESNQESHP
mgnify:CR=1 FL=1